ncbi:MAG: HAD family phosphatase [Kiloniellales bacterium]|nr:HAD family phosphatase [Kiloniellales bacterium]
MASPKVLLFDLGGVLVDFAGLREFPALLEDAPPSSEIRRRWEGSAAMAGFQRGEISTAEFARIFSAEWGLVLDTEAFIALFRSWNRAAFDGAHALLARLRPRFTLACLSNTNEVHWEDILDGHGLRSCFDHHYASHLLGMLKPDPEIYGFVAQDLGRAVSEIVFFDDGPDNVEGARAAGMEAHQVEGIADLEATLAARGLLDAEPDRLTRPAPPRP